MTEPDPGKEPADLSDDLRELEGLFLEARRSDLARLEAALERGDFATVRAVGHTFKGSSATFGFPEAGEIGAAIETAAESGNGDCVRELAARLRASIPGLDP